MLRVQRSAVDLTRISSEAEEDILGALAKNSLSLFTYPWTPLAKYCRRDWNKINIYVCTRSVVKTERYQIWVKV